MSAKKIPTQEALARELEEFSIPEPNSGCLLFLRRPNKHGYGRMNFGNVTIAAHRAAWEVAHGPIPAGMLVCHKCDVTACINPAHLFLGTHQANMDDMAGKGRARSGNFGEKHPSARLTAADVRAIRLDSRPRADVAAAYGITPESVWRVRERRSWKHVK